MKDLIHFSYQVVILPLTYRQLRAQLLLNYPEGLLVMDKHFNTSKLLRGTGVNLILIGLFSFIFILQNVELKPMAVIFFSLVLVLFIFLSFLGWWKNLEHFHKMLSAISKELTTPRNKLPK